MATRVEDKAQEIVDNIECLGEDLSLDEYHEFLIIIKDMVDSNAEATRDDIVRRGKKA